MDQEVCLPIGQVGISVYSRSVNSVSKCLRSVLSLVVTKTYKFGTHGKGFNCIMKNKQTKKSHNLQICDLNFVTCDGNLYLKLVICILVSCNNRSESCSLNCSRKSCSSLQSHITELRWKKHLSLNGTPKYQIVLTSQLNKSDYCLKIIFALCRG